MEMARHGFERGGVGGDIMLLFTAPNINVGVNPVVGGQDPSYFWIVVSHEEVVRYP